MIPPPLVLLLAFGVAPLCDVAPLCGTAPPAATGHVDGAAGDDAGPGTAAAPWKTLAHAAAALPPGGVCEVRAGLYRETVVPRDRQTFRAAPGAPVILTGCDRVAEWEPAPAPAPGAPRELRANVSGKVRALFADGVRQPLARHPDEGETPFDAAAWAAGSYEPVRRGRTGRVTFAAGPDDPPDRWAGGYYSGTHGPNCYNSVSGRIVGSGGRTLTLDQLSTEAALGFRGFVGAGRGYIIDHPAALDSPGEWYWADGVLRWIPPAGAAPAHSGPPAAEAQTRLWAFDLTGRTGVRIEGFRIHAASVLMEDAVECVVDRCDFRHHAPWGAFSYADYAEYRPASRPRPYSYGGPIDGTSGLHVSGRGNAVTNCTLAHAWGAGVSLRGEGNRLENCRIENVGWLARQCANPVVATGRDQRVVGNAIRRTGSTGVRFTQIGPVRIERPTIERNDISETGLVLVDGGSSGIYLSNHDSPTDDRTLGGGVIAENRIGRIHLAGGAKGFGIYLDDGTDHASVTRNVIDAGGAIRWGVFIHYAGHFSDDVFVAHNTIRGVRGPAVAAAGQRDRGGPRNVAVRNNLSTAAGFVSDAADHNLGGAPDGTFVNAHAGDLRLRPGPNPAVDAGVPLAELPPVPDGRPDLGAHERGVPPPAYGSDLPPIAD